MDDQMTPKNDLRDAIEAADRAGSIVTGHVRSIIDAAEARATDIEREAQAEASEIRAQALDAANNVLKRIDSVEGHLGELVSDLRKETDGLSSGPDRRSR